MSKRLTSTEKWADPWFRGLTPETKLLWFWLLDNCDLAGVIRPDLQLASFQIGQPIDEKHIVELGERLQTLPDGKLNIVKFVQFQYSVVSAELSAASSVHRGVIKALRLHKLLDNPSESLMQALPNASLSTKALNKAKAKAKAKEGVKGEIEILPDVLNVPEFKEAWSLWHEHLKQKKKPATPHARKLQLSKLAAMGLQRAVETLHNCIEHNWQSIYESDNGKSNGGGASVSKPALSDYDMLESISGKTLSEMTPEQRRFFATLT